MDYNYKRVFIQRTGYAIVPGGTDKEAIENAKDLDASDFQWEPFTPELVEDTAEVMESCGPNGETPEE